MMVTTFNDTVINSGDDDVLYNKDGVILWGIIDLVIIVFTLAGNILTAVAIKTCRKLNAVLSNQFIFNLAISDIMVAVFIPYHYAFSIGNTLGTQKTTCLLRFILICLACSCSIFNLLTIAADRYIAIVHPLHYGRYVTKRVAYGVIAYGWIACFTLATVPLYWNTWETADRCELDGVLPAQFLNFVITPLFVLIWLAMLLVYFRIWREASGHAKRLKSTAKYCNGAGLNDSKSVQVVLLIMGCFSICWLPYFGVLTYNRVINSFRSHMLYEIAFTLAMANSGMNPLIYAWKNTNFRKAFWCLLRCRNPNCPSYNNSFITNHVPSKKNSATNGMCFGIENEAMEHGIGVELKNGCNLAGAALDRELSVGTECTDANSLSIHL